MTVEKTAMILAAGKGERLKPLTNTLAKPLVQAGGKALILWQMERLKKAGFNHLVINVAYLPFQIKNFIQNSSEILNLNFKSILFSDENPALETAGGIKKALHLIEKTAKNLPFLVVNADVYTEFNYFHFFEKYKNIKKNEGVIVLNKNPKHHLQGDFSLNKNNFVILKNKQTFTYTGIGIFKKDFFNVVPENKPYPLKPVLENAILNQHLKGEKNTSFWLDVGTLERLKELELYLKKNCI